ncbi:DUF3892 domain-containing protein [Methylobacillus caricis]|uniref:DUF3892 domain-containing protein n=1 Tax=Methylobacillus caricis TaxID=1971611 RepID=UPI001CFF7A3E|nr:DUF3892 domain-containing protein [Methylobacillus caricis]MCB5187509.1 DUF3892 domain-containing protein [Methylobacillus caricis]
MSDYQVTCITKPNVNSTHESITALGGYGSNGQSWYDTRPNVIGFIESGQHRFYTKVNNVIAWVQVVRETNKVPYLRTVADGRYTNNLLSLDQCPVK